jgi:hypothetical protein
MLRFDYVRAWEQAALPAYETLPEEIDRLLTRVCAEARDLHQLHDCSMPWPEGTGLREAFDSIPVDVLAFASQVIHAYGRWFPSSHPLLVAGRALRGQEWGSHWKFSHYADQSLRARLGVPVKEPRGGFGRQIHEGAIRLTHSSARSWTRVEVAPATHEGMALALRLQNRLAVRTVPRNAAGNPDRRLTNQRDRNIYREFQKLMHGGSGLWPEPWRPFVDGRFMVVDAAPVIRSVFA